MKKYDFQLKGVNNFPNNVLSRTERKYVLSKAQKRDCANMSTSVKQVTSTENTTQPNICPRERTPCSADDEVNTLTSYQPCRAHCRILCLSNHIAFYTLPYLFHSLLVQSVLNAACCVLSSVARLDHFSLHFAIVALSYRLGILCRLPVQRDKETDKDGLAGCQRL